MFSDAAKTHLLGGRGRRQTDDIEPIEPAVSIFLTFHDAAEPSTQSAASRKACARASGRHDPQIWSLYSCGMSSVKVYALSSRAKKKPQFVTHSSRHESARAGQTRCVAFDVMLTTEGFQQWPIPCLCCRLHRRQKRDELRLELAGVAFLEMNGSFHLQQCLLNPPNRIRQHLFAPPDFCRRP